MKNLYEEPKFNISRVHDELVLWFSGDLKKQGKMYGYKFGENDLSIKGEGRIWNDSDRKLLIAVQVDRPRMFGWLFAWDTYGRQDENGNPFWTWYAPLRKFIFEKWCLDNDIHNYWV